MKKRHTTRVVPLALTMLIALVGAVVALGLSGGGDTAAHATAKPRISSSELALRNEMRRLWEDHITWTRMAILSLTAGTPDTDASVARLLQNQTDIGNAIKPFYGEVAGNELTRLLRGHITIAAELIAAAKAGDQAALADAQARWEANADEIALFLNEANPGSWELEPTKAMLHEHLSLTTQEAVARLQGDWDADVAAYDEIHRQALHMADMLSTGIVNQFPRSFR